MIDWSSMDFVTASLTLGRRRCSDGNGMMQAIIDERADEQQRLVDGAGGVSISGSPTTKRAALRRC